MPLARFRRVARAWDVGWEEGGRAADMVKAVVGAGQVGVVVSAGGGARSWRTAIAVIGSKNDSDRAGTMYGLWGLRRLLSGGCDSDHR